MCSAGLLYAQREHTDSRSDTVGVRVEGRRVLPLTLSCRSVVLPRTVHRVMLSRRSVRGSLRYFYVPTITTTRTFVRGYRKRPVGLLLRGATSADIVAETSPTCTSRTVRISVISYQTAHVTSWVQPSCCRCRRHGRARGRQGVIGHGSRSADPDRRTRAPIGASTHGRCVDRIAR